MLMAKSRISAPHFWQTLSHVAHPSQDENGGPAKPKTTLDGAKDGVPVKANTNSKTASKATSKVKDLVGDVGEAYLYRGFVGFGYLEHCARL
jgi:hypothetical protein